MSYGHMLGFICCIGVIEMMLWAVSYELMDLIENRGIYAGPLMILLNGLLAFLTLPVWILYWFVGLVCLVIEGFRKGISSWKMRECEKNRQEGASEGS